MPEQETTEKSKEGLIGVICSEDSEGNLTKAHCFEGSGYHKKMIESGEIDQTTKVYIPNTCLAKLIPNCFNGNEFEFNMAMILDYEVKA